MATMQPSLFGSQMSPEDMQQQLIDQRAAQFAAQSQAQQLGSMGYKAGANLGGGLAKAFGVDTTDPMIKQATQMRQLASQFDTTTPEGMAQFSQALRSINPQAAQQAAEKAVEMRGAMADVQKKELSASQEASLRNELSRLGPDATQEDIMKVVTKYGSADKILTLLQTSADKQVQNQMKLDMAVAADKAKIEAARIAGESKETIARMMMDGRKEIAALTASLKGPSPAVLKAEEKAAKIAEGQQGLADTVEVAKTLVKDIADKGGMTTTSQSALANMVTSLGTGTVGQFASRAAGTEVQSKRDELKSVRLQLLNAVKESTGMSATQLNSNVELKTWLDSLGAENMTKEANLAILNNISNRYLKPGAKPPMVPSAAPTPPAQQPVYAVNPTTKERIMSTDGGNTWTKAR